MRTTLNIENDALMVIRKYAEERDLSLGQAASDLVHRGAESLPKFKTKNGWALLEPAPGSPPLTLELMEQWENDDNAEEYRRAISPRC
jgi:hypothetical protein